MTPSQFIVGAALGNLFLWSCLLIRFGDHQGLWFYGLSVVIIYASAFSFSRGLVKHE